MAGRGGGAGRGRASMSFKVEQLGFTPGENLPEPVLQPPPLYPIMEFCPYNLEMDDTYKEQITVKTQLFNYLNSSSAFVPADEVQKGLGNSMDTNKEALTINKQLEYDWTQFPPELVPFVKKKRKLSKTEFKVPNKIARKQNANVSTILDELEKKEVTEKDKENESEAKEKKMKEDEEADKEEYEEEDLDEEMDDGTDYNLNYFDNGEGYLDDEDDNLDDGPIY